MKKALALVLTLVASAGLFADEYYVDANYGRDDDLAYDGTAPDKAKKTLVEVMKLATKSGDVVYAAEGDYNEGADVYPEGSTISNRVTLAEGVTLAASGRRDKTVIWGADSPTPTKSGTFNGASYALGPNAVRCVYLCKDAVLKGFTIAGGRTDSNAATSGDSYYGGGIMAAQVGKGVVVDCTITNCFGAWSAGVRNGVYVRCIFDTITGMNYNASLGFGYYFCCYMDHIGGSYSFHDTQGAWNCTIGPDVTNVRAAGGSGWNGWFYNSILLCKQITNLELDNCAVVTTLSISGTTITNNCVYIPLRDMKLDATDWYRPQTDSPLRDAGSNDLLALQKFLDACPEAERVLDFGKDQRIYNKTVDIGAFEYDTRAEFSSVLAQSRVNVTAASSTVSDTGTGALKLEDAGELRIVWTSPTPGKTVDYSFDLQVQGEGTLSVYLDGGETPFATYVESDGPQTLEFASEADSVGLRLDFAGAGAATVSRFLDCYSANIIAPDKGLAVSGDLTAPGEYILTSPVTFTVRRALDSSRLCTGITTNGSFVSWDDLPDGLTCTVSDKRSSITIRAVYQTGKQTWYVDAVNGDDANSGFLETDAKLTLADVVTNTTIGADDTIIALPGTYRTGAVTCPGTAETTASRAYVPPYVTLVSRDGAETTFIEGGDPDETLVSGTFFSIPYALGPGAVRCVYLSEYASVCGFTLKGGRTNYDASKSTADYCGAGVYAAGGKTSWIVDCVITNCYGNWTGATAGQVNMVRTKVSHVGGYKYEACVGNSASLYDCFLDYMSGSYGVYSPAIQVNCTFGPNSDCGIRHGGVGDCPTYNCIVLCACQQGVTYNHCIIAKEKALTGSGQVYAADTVTNVSLATLVAELDATRDYAPRKGSRFVDAALNEYLEKIPAEYRSKDLRSGPRVYGCTVDYGAQEYDLRVDASTALDRLGGVTVRAMDANVTVANDAVLIPSGESVSLDWSACPQLPETRYEYSVALGSGRVSVYEGETLLETITESGVRSFVRADSVSLRFVADGEGVSLSRFSNCAQAVILAPNGGLAVEGGCVGTNVAPSSGTRVLTLRRTFDSPTLTRGVRINDEYRDFDDFPNGIELVLDDAQREQGYLVETVFDETTTDWFVDPAKGDDDAKGYHLDCPLKTLQKTLDERCSAGMTVHLLPGRYETGSRRGNSTKGVPEKTLSRVIVPAGVNLVGVGKAEDVLIVGEAAPEENQVPGLNGCGEDAVRCLYLQGDSTIRNVTLTQGRVYAHGGISDNDYESHAAARNVGKTCYFIDCIVSNNYANVGAGLNQAVMIRCRICRNVAVWYASGSEDSDLYNCIVDHNTGSYPVHRGNHVNCTFGPGNSQDDLRYGGNSSGDVYNSLIMGWANSSEKARFHRTFFAGDSKNYVTETNLLDGTKQATTDGIVVTLDGDFRPVKGQCDAIDAGNDDYLSLLPANYADEAMKYDFYGNPRALGASVDIGAVEYDWRGEFTQDLGRKVVVTDASAGVVETEAKTVSIPDGGEVVVGWKDRTKAPKDRIFRFNVADGTLTVKVNGEAVAAFTANGEWTYRSGAATDKISFSFVASEEGGTAELLRSTADIGVLLIVR